MDLLLRFFFGNKWISIVLRIVKFYGAPVGSGHKVCLGHIANLLISFNWSDFGFVMVVLWLL